MSENESFPRPRRRKGSGAVTLRDVALIAGVAPITASRAINTPNQVSPEVRERVTEAVRKTGYVPNLLAGALSSMKSRMVGLAVPTIAGPVFLDTVQSLTEALFEAGYQVLTRSAQAGVDVFVRQYASRFVFFQGHPEYDALSLQREYLRDMALFLDGEGERPAIPENYFDRVTENALQALAARQAQIVDYTEVVTGAVPLQSWRGTTLRLFANWIGSIAAEKPRRRIARAVTAHRSA